VRIRHSDKRTEYMPLRMCRMRDKSSLTLPATRLGEDSSRSPAARASQLRHGPSPWRVAETSLFL